MFAWKWRPSAATIRCSDARQTFWMYGTTCWPQAGTPNMSPRRPPARWRHGDARAPTPGTRRGLRRRPAAASTSVTWTDGPGVHRRRERVDPYHGQSDASDGDVARVRCDSTSPARCKLDRIEHLQSSPRPVYYLPARLHAPQPLQRGVLFVHASPVSLHC